jgi:hypothetical protein
MTAEMQTSLLRRALLATGILLCFVSGVFYSDGNAAGSQCATDVRLIPSTMRSQEWTLVPGLGPHIAQQLDAARRSGRFHDLYGTELMEELSGVRGVGEMTLRRLEPFLLTKPVQGKGLTTQ